MRQLNSALFFALLILGLSATAHAKDYMAYANYERALNPNDPVQVLSNRTLWRADYDILRIYFANDKTLQVQFFRDMGNQSTGNIIEGSWRIDEETSNKNVCFDVPEFQILSTCFIMQHQKLDDITNGYYNETHFLDIDTKQPFMVFNRRMEGNGILKSEFVPYIYQNIHDLYAIIDKQDNLSSSDIQKKPYEDIDSLNPAVKHFIGLVENRVFDAPLNYQYYNSNGARATITKADLQKNKGNIDVLKQNVMCSRWWAEEGNTFCHSYDREPTTQNPKPFGISCTSLYKPEIMNSNFEGIVTNSEHRATMAHDNENFIALEEFPYPEIFAKCQ